ncbi:MAG: hypothetical protein ACK4UN_20280 [Limisphaerales bacterium]
MIALPLLLFGMMVALGFRLPSLRLDAGRSEEKRFKEQIWCRRLSVLMIAVPVLTVMAVLCLLFWRTYGKGPGLYIFKHQLAFAAKAWLVTGLLGLLLAIRSSHIAGGRDPILN